MSKQEPENQEPENIDWDNLTTAQKPVKKMGAQLGGSDKKAWIGIDYQGGGSWMPKADAQVQLALSLWNMGHKAVYDTSRKTLTFEKKSQ